MKRNCSVFCFLMLACASFAAGEEKPWIEGRSPHFRVLTNTSAGEARRVCREFEQLRGVFATQYPNFRLESGAPLVIFAVRDEDTARALNPNVFKKSAGGFITGVYQHSWEKQYALVRLDTWGQGTQRAVYFDYAAAVFRLNARWIPLWLDTGFSEFYGATQFRESETLLGVPPPYLAMLRRKSPVPVETLVTQNVRSSYYTDEDTAPMFHAESWFLVHYLIFGPNMDGGAKLDHFFALLQDGVNQKKAFEDTFGSFASVDDALRLYLKNFSLHALRLRNPPQIDEKEYPSRVLSMAETQAELGGYHLWTRDYVNARAYVSDALKNDPKLGLAHEEAGFLDLHDGRDAESLEQFSEALADDKTLYLSMFAKSMMSPQAASSLPADQSAFRHSLAETLNLNLQFAPAFIQMARLSLRQNDLNAALRYALRAESLEPSRAGYHTFTGQILLRMGRGSEAAEAARFVAERWTAADHNEAVELWNSVPDAQRPPGTVLESWSPKDTQRAEGKLESIVCGDKENESLTVAQGDKTMKFHRTRYRFGFSDTFWYGQNHMSLCHHMEGFRVIVHYKPLSGNAYAGEIVEIEVRDDLPPAPLAGDKPASSGPEKP